MPTIAYLGPEHTNTHLAAVSRFGRRARYLHAPTVDDVFHLVERRRAQYGVVPVENSLEGAVTHTLDRFIDFVDTPVTIHGEIEQPIRHCLIFRPASSRAAIRIVYSHPQALAQCQRWLTEHLPGLTSVRETSSTAEAVQHLLRTGQGLWKLRERAAIAREELAAQHKLSSMPIPQERENRTRFVILGLGRPKRGRRNKTSMLVLLKDRPGALHDMLVPFKKARINMTKIESRPSKKKVWSYYFFVDFEGHKEDPRVKQVLKALERKCVFFKVMGSYPKAEA